MRCLWFSIVGDRRLFWNKCWFGDRSKFNPIPCLCFGLQLTLPMGFQGQGGSIITSLAFYSCLCVMILRVHSEFPILGPVPIWYLGMVRLLLKWPPSVSSGTTGRFEPTTLQPKAPTLYRLRCPDRQIEILLKSQGCWSKGTGSNWDLFANRYLFQNKKRTLENHEQPM